MSKRSFTRPRETVLRIGNLVLKELIQLRRDWVMTAFIFTLPVLQLILLAHATSSRISDLCFVALDRDRSRASRRLITLLDQRRELTWCRSAKTLEETHGLLERGNVTLAVVVPQGFSSSISNASQNPSLQLIADGSNDIVGDIALSAARATLADFAAESTPNADNRPPVVDLRTTVRFNATFDVKFFTVPAQVGFIIYQVTLTVASIGLARERELGTLEQLIVMPLRRVELIVGKAIPALIAGGLNFLLMLGVAIHGFHVPMRGSLLLLLALTLLFVIAEISYGIFISSIAHTQQQAILLVFVLAMVDMAFSGYLVRTKNLPALLQAIAQIVPFHHYLTIIRGVMLKEAGLDALWPNAAAMLVMGLLVNAFAVWNLSQRLD